MSENPLLEDTSTSEDFFDSINEEQLQEATAWENIKFALSKLGRYKAGGKIRGKKKLDKKEIDRIETLLDKSANDQIKNIKKKIDKEFEGFPNNKEQNTFIDGVLEIAKVYDSIKSEVESGKLPVEAGNAFIEELKEYVKDILDRQLKAIYSITNENQELEEKVTIDPDANPKDITTLKFKPVKDAIKSGDLTAYETERIKTLKSWSLPIKLVLTALSAAGLGWLFDALSGGEEEVTVETLKKFTDVAGEIKPGEGMTQVFNRVYDTSFNVNSDPQELADFIKNTIGGGNTETAINNLTNNGAEGVGGLFTNGDEAKATLEAFMADPDAKGDTLKDVFKGDWAGTGKTATDTLDTLAGNKLVATVTKIILKTVIISTAKYTLAKSVLGGLGIGLGVGAVAVALSRYKGRKSSRAQVLNDLFQYLRPIEPTKSNPEVLKVAATSKDKPSPPPAVSQEKDGVSIAKTGNFDNMNRHNQIAVILQQINPSLDIYDKLESEGIKSELTGQLDDILKNEKASNELKKLAKLIITIRKSPNAFLKKVAKATGVEFSIRAKAKMTGYGKKGQSAAKLGLTETVLQSLKEGIIDDMIKDEDISAKKIDVIALLGSMYKSDSQKDGKRLSVLDQSKLSDEDKSKLKGIGFSTKEKSGKYMFMDDDEYKEFVKNKEKEKPATNQTQTTDQEFKDNPKLRAIEDRLENLPTLQIAFKQIDQTSEVDPFLLGILSYLNPKFENDKILLLKILRGALTKLQSKNREARKKASQLNEEIKKTKKQVSTALEKFENDPQLPRRLSQVVKINNVIDFLVNTIFDNDDPDVNLLPGASFKEIEQGFLRTIKALQTDKDIKKSFDSKSKEDDEKGLDVFTANYLNPETSSTTAGDQKINYTLTKEQLQSLIKNIITEGLTPSQASKVKDKYKQIYSGMLKGDKKKLLKYIDDKFGRQNPDAMAMGRAVNLSKKEEDENVEEAKTEKQRKYMCVMAQQGAKRPKGLSKAQAKEMCADTGLSKSKQEEQKLSEIDDIMDENLERKSIPYEKVAELIKKELKSEENKRKITDLKMILRKIEDKETFMLSTDRQKMLTKLISQAKNIKESGKDIAGVNMDNYKKSNMKNNRLTELIKTALKGPLNEATDLVDRDGYQFTRFSMGEEGPGLQITSQGGNYITIPGSKLGVFASALTDAIRVFDDMERQLPVDEAEFTDKYNDHPDLTDKQKNLPDALQKGILGLEEDNIDEDKIPGSNIKKVGDKYRVLSGKTGKMWKQKYDSKKDAEAALRGYFASKNESLSERIFKELRK